MHHPSGACTTGWLGHNRRLGQQQKASGELRGLVTVRLYNAGTPKLLNLVLGCFVKLYENQMKEHSSEIWTIGEVRKNSTKGQKARFLSFVLGMMRRAIVGSWRQGNAVAGLAMSHGDRLQHQINASGNGRSAWLARLHPNPCCMYLVLRPVLPLKMYCLRSKAQRWYKEWRKDGKKWYSPEKELGLKKKGFPKWRPVLETADSPTGKKAQKLPNTDIYGHYRNRPKHEQKGGAKFQLETS